MRHTPGLPSPAPACQPASQRQTMKPASRQAFFPPGQDTVSAPRLRGTQHTGRQKVGMPAGAACATPLPSGGVNTSLLTSPCHATPRRTGPPSHTHTPPGLPAMACRHEIERRGERGFLFFSLAFLEGERHMPPGWRCQKSAASATVHHHI